VARVDILKALDVAGASVLVQPEIDKVIANLVDYQNPLRQNLPRKPGSGQAWILNRRSPAANTPAAWVADTEDFVEDEGSYEQVNFYYKTVGARVKVTRKAQAIGRTYADMLAEEIEARALEVRNQEDYAYTIGIENATAGSTCFSGLHYLIQSYNSQEQVVSCVAGTDTPGALTLTKMDEAIDKCAGDPNMLVMSKRSRRLLLQLLQIYQRFVDRVEVRGGFKLLSYNEIPIYISTNIPDTMALAADGSSIVGLTGGTTSAIYVVNTEQVWVGELTPLHMEPLAKKSSQYDEWDIYCDEVLVMRNPLYNSMLIGFGE